MPSLASELTEALEQRRQASLYRQRRSVGADDAAPYYRRAGKTYLSFCSNDYLGLAQHPKVIEAMVNAAKRYGVGSGASHLVCGHSEEHRALEEEFADYVGRPRALLFASGYQANMGTLAALLDAGDAVFEDRLNHASLLDGGLLSAARFSRFRHNDMEHLEEQLTSRRARRRIIAVDGVFSMDGDFADLPALVNLAKRYQAWLMVDDAHALGCVGAKGRGTLEHFGCAMDDVPILVSTLGKALGTHGALVSGSDSLIEYLIQFARPYIYTTAMPAALAAATRASLRLLRDEPERRARLDALIQYFRQGCERMGIALMSSTTAIQPVLIGDAARTLEIEAQLAERGFWIAAIRPPTVPEGTARLRVTLSAVHELSQLDALIEGLAEVLSAG